MSNEPELAQNEGTDLESDAGGEATIVKDAPAKHVFPQFQNPAPGTKAVHEDLDLILDIPVQITVELGRTRMPIKNVLQLSQGSVVELEGLAGERLDVLVNGCLIAQGEVVVVNDRFGIRLTDIVTPSERLRRLNT
jgi:flagellar motor switch protein FliN